MLIVICITILTVVVAVGIGYLGYLAFGEKTKSVILFNLPNDDPASIAAKIFYILTIMGSFVLVANPVFRVIEKSGWYRSLAGIDDDSLNSPAKLAKNGSSMPAMNLADDSPEPKEPGAAANLSEENKSGNEGGEKSVCSYEEDDPLTCCSGIVYFGFRTLIIILLCVIAFSIPNINILLTIGGALLGTIVNIVLPILFYNRAYAFSAKNRMLEQPSQ